ncbi:hypothetical protein ACFP3Q_08340 [Nocardioides sp. GCM10027113]
MFDASSSPFLQSELEYRAARLRAAARPRRREGRRQHPRQSRQNRPDAGR